MGDPVTQRVMTNARIVHKDLAIGHGVVKQNRGHGVIEEQSIEVMFIFRTLDEIKRLDTNIYTHIGLHRAAGVSEYYYEPFSEIPDDDSKVIKPYVVTRAGRWIRVYDVLDLRAELVAKGVLTDV